MRLPLNLADFGLHQLAAVTERIKIQKGGGSVTQEDLERFINHKRATSNPLVLVNSARGCFTWLSSQLFRCLLELRGLRDFRIVHFLHLEANHSLRRTFLYHLERRAWLKSLVEKNPELKQRHVQEISFTKLMLSKSFSCIII